MEIRLRYGHHLEEIYELNELVHADGERRRIEARVCETGMQNGVYPEAARTPRCGWRCLKRSLVRSHAANGWHGKSSTPPRATKATSKPERDRRIHH